MIIQYDQVDCLVNSSGILADSASIASNNTLDGVYTIGKYSVRNQVPSGPEKSSFSISYYPIVTGDPTYFQLNTIKNLVDSIQYSGVPIVVAGISGSSCYLTNYKIQALPNQLVQVKAIYETFQPLSGSIQNKSSAINYYTDKEKIPHAWTTYISSSGNKLIAPTYNFEYGFTADWEPVYLIGQKTPREVHLMAMREDMAFTRDSFQLIQFSGEAVTGSFITGDFTIDVYDYNLICGNNNGNFSYNISGSHIIKSDMAVNVDDIVQTRTNIQKFS